MKDGTFEKVMVSFLMAIGIIFLMVVVGAIVQKDMKAVYDERLTCIEEIAKTKAYDRGDTTDMWWAVVEIAGGIE